MDNLINEKELIMMIRQLNGSENNEKQVSSIWETDVQPEENQPHQHQNYLWIDNNKIFSHFGSKNGSYPVIEAVYPTIVQVNGQIIDRPTPVGPEDVIEWTVEERPLFDITVSEDGIQAFLTVHSRERYGWKLPAAEKSARIKVAAEQDRSIIFESVNISDIMKALTDMKITKNIRTDAIYEALFAHISNPVLIAEGLMPVPSQDAKLELYFSENIEKNLREINGQVDFRNILHIPSVTKDEVIAKKIPPKPGIPGFDVYGQILRPESPKDIFIVAKESVKITSEGEIIALKEGRPRITGDRIKFFEIASSYIVPGDVNMSTGNIVFAGDVIVHGDVADGMIVESLGNVYIAGNVYKSTITATGSIMVRGNTVLNSNLYSGYFGVTFNRLYISLKSMLDQLHQFSLGLQQLIQVLEARGLEIPLHQAAMTLIETKFQNLPAAAKELEQNILAVINLKSAELEEVIAHVKIFTRAMNLIHFKDRGQLDTTLYRIREAYNMIERQQESDAWIDIMQANSATLMATGNVIIRKEGVIQTDIHSKGNILFNGRESVCRGGVLEAEGSIHVGHAGAETGVQTLLRAKKRISADRVHNCLIQVDRFKKPIPGTRNNFEAYVSNGQFVLRSEEDDPAGAESSFRSNQRML